VIEGMRLQITAAQLHEHLTERESHHRNRAAFYDSKRRELEAAGEQPQQLTNDPVKAMADRATHHHHKAAAFGTWAKYLIPGETYRLDNGDLSRLEMAYL
jgi:hypothetical protein